MICFVYILECFDGSFYTGITSDLNRRLKEHNLRIKSPLQISKIPVKLMYWEEYKSRQEAAKREKEIKGWRREKKIKLINSLH